VPDVVAGGVSHAGSADLGMDSEMILFQLRIVSAQVQKLTNAHVST
jgi:hypothetical protein